MIFTKIYKQHAFSMLILVVLLTSCKTTGDIKGKVPTGWEAISHYHVKNELVTDTKTNLTWMRCSYGQEWEDSTCAGEAKEINYNQSTAYAKTVNINGLKGWRIPTLKELKSIVYCSTHKPKEWNDTGKDCEGNYERPTILKRAFPNTRDEAYWTTNLPDPKDNNRVSVIYFYFGSELAGVKNHKHGFLRLVRNN